MSGGFFTNHSCVGGIRYFILIKKHCYNEKLEDILRKLDLNLNLGEIYDYEYQNDEFDKINEILNNPIIKNGLETGKYLIIRLYRNYDRDEFPSSIRKDRNERHRLVSMRIDDDKIRTIKQIEASDRAEFLELERS